MPTPNSKTAFVITTYLASFDGTCCGRSVSRSVLYWLKVHPALNKMEVKLDHFNGHAVGQKYLQLSGWNFKAIQTGRGFSQDTVMYLYKGKCLSARNYYVYIFDDCVYRKKLVLSQKKSVGNFVVVVGVRH